MTRRHRPLIPVSFERAKLLASITEAVGACVARPFSRELQDTKDQVELLRTDNIVSPQAVAGGRICATLG